MTDAGLSAEVRRFIADHIGSVAQLEILLFLQGRSAERFDAAAVGRALYIEPEWAANELRSLRDAGLLDEVTNSAPTYRFAPAEPALAHGVEALAAAYRERRMGVIDVILAQPSKTILGFAEAFRLRRD